MPNFITSALVKQRVKNTLHILIFLIFNSFLANNLLGNNATFFVAYKALQKQDTTRIVQDTVIVKKEQLDDIVRTKADNIRNDVVKKVSLLNKNAVVTYQDMRIDADYVSIDWNTGIIFARGKIDDNGKIVEPAIATQGGKKYEYDQFSYNYRTRQAIAYNARTEESEGVVIAEKTKKYNDSVFYMRRGKFTTDEIFIKKKDTIADYYLLAPDIKLIKGEKKSQLVTGPVQLYVERVPTPLVMPFAILPFSDKRSAGILIPSFGEREDVGFFLNGLGYYQPLGDHFDLKLLLDFYTKGSWNLRPEVNYLKKYKFSGNFLAEFGTTIRGIKGLDDYSKARTFNITWSHRQDTKANPFLTFGASVNIVSSKFYSNTVNNNHLFNNSVLNAQQNSSINVQKRFLTLPITITATGNYSQNFSTGLTDIRLPNVVVSANQFYLFKPKTGMREGLLENINVNTGLSLTNFVQIPQEETFTQAMWDKMQTGLKNNISLGTNTTVAKYFTLSLSANADNVLTTKTVRKIYNPLSDSVENITQKGIRGFSNFSTGASMQTILYGMAKFKKGSRIEAIRHMITPSIGFAYAPDFGAPSWNYYSSYYNALGEPVNYSIFEGGVYGVPPTGLTKAITFNIGNNLEMKVRSKSDSTGVKKIKIFENLNISGGYNFAAPVYKWSPFMINSQTSLLQNKLNINTNMVIEPYEIFFAVNSNTGVRTDNFGKFSVQVFNVNLSYPLSEAIFGKKDDPAQKYKKQGAVMQEPYYFDEDNYARFKQPWSLNINANYAYNRALSRFGTNVASIGLDGSLKLTPYWSLHGSTHYDVVAKELSYTNIGFSRDQRSFTINFNWVPFGPYKVYDFFIGIKANILKDALKYKERSFTQPNSSF